VSIPAFAGVSADGTTSAAFAAGPDQSSRFILVSGADLDLLQEVIGLIEFTGLADE
jgi:hypothetical protein